MDKSSNLNFLPVNRTELFQNLQEFISLWDKLEKNGLIKNLPRSTIASNATKFIVKKAQGNRYETDWEFIPIIYQYHNIQIYCLPELKKFIENKYKTNEEIQHEKEFEYMELNLKVTKKAQNTTKWIAAISIIVSIVSLLANLYFYSINRTVSITNPNAFKDTTHIIILNKFPDDSVNNQEKIIK